MNDNNTITARLRRLIAVSIVVSGGALMAVIFTAIAPVLSSIGLHFGGGAGGDFIAQLVMTVPAVGIIVGAPAVGFAIEKFGARRIFFTALIVFGCAGSAGLVTEQAWALLTSRFILGVAGAGVSTSTTALIGEWFEGSARSRMLGYWSSLGAVGGVTAVLLSGAIGESGGWQAPFAIHLIAFVALAFALYSIRPGSPATISTPETMNAVTGNGSILSLWPIYALMIPLYVGVFMTGVQLSFLIAANGINSPAEQSWIISMASVGSAIGAFFFGWIISWLGRRRTFILFVSMMGIANIFMGTVDDPLLVAIGAAFNGMGGGISNPFFASLILERAPIEIRGRALGFMYTVWFGGEFINPLIVTPLRMISSLHGAFVIIGSVLLLIAIIFALRRKTMVS
ncbi:MAG: MFS transporter [Candidatus Marinimicrobia bacterium]|nr:MFS transporter [Candidatus Neomarinimicrobiota bacterium]